MVGTATFLLNLETRTVRELFNFVQVSQPLLYGGFIQNDVDAAPKEMTIQDLLPK